MKSQIKKGSRWSRKLYCNEYITVTSVGEYIEYVDENKQNFAKITQAHYANDGALLADFLNWYEPLTNDVIKSQLESQIKEVRKRQELQQRPRNY